MKIIFRISRFVEKYFQKKSFGSDFGKISKFEVKYKMFVLNPNSGERSRSQHLSQEEVI